MGKIKVTGVIKQTRPDHILLSIHRGVPVIFVECLGADAVFDVGERVKVTGRVFGDDFEICIFAHRISNKKEAVRKGVEPKIWQIAEPAPTPEILVYGSTEDV